MNEKTGRNDPCPCGSGKKYKKCCLSIEDKQSRGFPEIADKDWLALRRLEGVVFDQHLLPFATQELPQEVIKYALADCFPEDLPESFDERAFFDQFFLPWFLFNWLPYDDFGLTQFVPEISLAANYLTLYGDQLNAREKRFIQAMNQTYYSFYAVLEVKLNESLLVKDILLGTTHTLKERQGTHQLKRGDIVFSRILTLEDQSIFVGMAPLIVPADYHTNLLDFKRWLIEENENNPLTTESLREEFEFDLHQHFFEVITAAYNRPPPTLVNTDGDLFQFTTSSFKLTLSPEEALQRLLPLTLEKDAEPFLEEAQRTKTGKIKQIELPWLKKGNKQHKHWDNTVMGHLKIKPGKLILETNSEKRAQKGKKLLSKYLEHAITFEKTVIESPEKKMNSLPDSTKQTSISRNEDLMYQPQVQEELREFVKAHWENWFEQTIPVLDHQTPRQAAKTPEGRERLEALLLQFERHDLERGNHPLKVDIDYLKSELGLD